MSESGVVTEGGAVADVRLIWTTFPDRVSAQEWLMPLVERGVVACGNLFPAMGSVYRWKGAVEVAEECGLLMKTTVSRVEEVREALGRHPYEVPAFVVLGVEGVAPAYLQWLLEETRRVGG
jgi:periplasmic divalent cation tolerance protein